MWKCHFTLRRAKTEVTRIFGEIKLRDFPFFPGPDVPHRRGLGKPRARSRGKRGSHLDAR